MPLEGVAPPFPPVLALPTALTPVEFGALAVVGDSVVLLPLPLLSTAPP